MGIWAIEGVGSDGEQRGGIEGGDLVRKEGRGAQGRNSVNKRGSEGVSDRKSVV